MVSRNLTVEKEMLSEARARLVNTQGKKAKRKAREKQLEEARRLTSIQKKRELKAAGLELKEKERVKPGMNYNIDIPFQKTQPAGFWDVNEERLRESHEKLNLANSMLERLEGKRRMAVEDEARKRDFKKHKAKKDAGDDAPLQYLKDTQGLQVTERKKYLV